jgi:hypothetical protein
MSVFKPSICNQSSNFIAIRGGSRGIEGISSVVKKNTYFTELGINIMEYPNDNFSHILGINDSNHIPSKLQEICRKRLIDVVRNKTPIDTQGCGIDRTMYVSADDLIEEIREFDDLYGKPLNISERIALSYPQMAIAAEFKRASPSKGDININVDAVSQCLEYAEVGAAIISVLTEFQHFKGN